jgi:oligopeptidase A
MTNPLLTMDGLPPFSQIKPEHIKPAVEHAIADCKKRVETVLARHEEFTWDNLVAPLEEVNDHLSRIWSPIGHLNGVMNSEALRQAYESCLPLLSEYHTWMGQHEGLFEAYQSLADRDDFKKLSLAQQKEVDNTLRDFRLSGIALEAEQKKRFGAIQARLSELASTFSNRVLDATQAWVKHITDQALLAGLPESALAAAEAQARARELDGWVFTLDIPSYLPVMMYADDAALREELYRAYCTRASDQGPNAGQFDNTAIIEETLALKQELAELLGYDNYAQVSLATKMARSEQQVLDFLEQLAERSHPQGEAELAELTAFACEQHGVARLNAWDISYYAEKLKRGIRTCASSTSTTTAASCAAASTSTSTPAPTSAAAPGWTTAGAAGEDGSLQKPVAYLTCNFTRPVGEQAGAAHPQRGAPPCSTSSATACTTC